MASSRKRVVIVDEGPDAARRFDHTMTRVLGVSKEELAKREAAYQKSRRSKKRSRTAT